MSASYTPLTCFPNAIEQRHMGGNITTGFAWVELGANTVSQATLLPHHYALFLLKGHCLVSCHLFENKELNEGEFYIFAKEHPFRLECREASQLVVMVFDVPLIQADKVMFKYCCSRAMRKVFSFHASTMKGPLLSAVEGVADCLKDNKIRDTRFYSLKNTELFFYLLFYYDRDEVADVLFPLVNINYSFKYFVLNNYLEADRNVENLIYLSGMGRSAFFSKFKQEFGMTAKQWFMMQEAGILASKAAQPGMTVQRLMLVMGISSPLRLYRMCRKYFDQTPRELILSLAPDKP